MPVIICGVLTKSHPNSILITEQVDHITTGCGTMKKIIISGILILTAIFCGCDNDKKTYSSSSSSSSEKTSSSDGFSRRRYRAQVLTSQNNLKQIGNALSMYTECSKGMLLPHGETRSGNIDTAPEYAFEVLRSQGYLTDHKAFAAPYGKTKVGKGNDKFAYGREDFYNSLERWLKDLR